MLGCFAVNTIGVFADEWSATDNHLGVIHFQAQGEREGMRWNRENSAGKCSVLVIVLQLVFPFSFLFYFIFTWLFIFCRHLNITLEYFKNMWKGLKRMTNSTLKASSTCFA